MLDFYYYSIDNINTKMNLYNQFKDSFNYYDYMDELIHNPIIKSISFLASKNYFNRCYKNKIKFYKRFKLNHRRYILHKIISKIFKSKYNIKDFINKNKIDTKLLNLANNEIDINDKKINKSLDDVIAIARDELNNYIDAINDYLFNDRDKNINKLLDE